MITSCLRSLFTVLIFFGRRPNFLGSSQATWSETASLSLHFPRPIFSWIMLGSPRHSWTLSTSAIAKGCHEATRFLASEPKLMLLGLITIRIAMERNYRYRIWLLKVLSTDLWPVDDTGAGWTIAKLLLENEGLLDHIVLRLRLDTSAAIRASRCGRPLLSRLFSREISRRYRSLPLHLSLNAPTWWLYLRNAWLLPSLALWAWELNTCHFNLVHILHGHLSLSGCLICDNHVRRALLVTYYRLIKFKYFLLRILDHY